MEKTKEEINPEEEFTFTSYYKYQFSFTSKNWEITVGGDSDDIYRSSVDPVMTWKQIEEEFDLEFFRLEKITKE